MKSPRLRSQREDADRALPVQRAQSPAAPIPALARLDFARESYTFGADCPALSGHARPLESMLYRIENRIERQFCLHFPVSC